MIMYILLMLSCFAIFALFAWWLADIRMCLPNTVAFGSISLISGYLALVFFSSVTFFLKDTNEEVKRNRKSKSVAVSIDSFNYIFKREFCADTSTKLSDVQEIKSGIFVANLYDINIPDNSFKASFWIWLRFKDSSCSKILGGKYLDVFDVREIKQRMYNTETIRDGDEYWSWAFYNATFVKDWNVINFPFDGHTVKIEAEDALADFRGHKFVADSLTLGGPDKTYDSRTTYSDWEHSNDTFYTLLDQFQTTFGDNSLTSGNSYYSQMRWEADIYRNNSSVLYFKIFLGLFAGYLVCMLGFLVVVDSVARFSLHIAGIIVAITNKLNVDKIIPQHHSFTLADYTHTICYSGMILAIFVSAYQLHCTRKLKFEKDKDDYLSGDLPKSHYQNGAQLLVLFIAVAIVLNLVLVHIMTNVVEFEQTLR